MGSDIFLNRRDIGKPMACCSEEELEEDKEEEKHEHNGERHREDEGVQKKERKVYKVLGRLTAQGKTYQVDEDELRRKHVHKHVPNVDKGLYCIHVRTYKSTKVVIRCSGKIKIVQGLAINKHKYLRCF